jgi:hypothetical protein
MILVVTAVQAVVAAGEAESVVVHFQQDKDLLVAIQAKIAMLVLVAVALVQQVQQILEQMAEQRE